ncbi:MAG: hypothetical protein ACOC1I_02575 [Spirochaetota bacterium]
MRHTSDSHDEHPDEDAAPRAEELIVEVYRQRAVLVEQGEEPSRVVMSKDHYRAIQEYRARLGEVADGHADYMDRYRLFDLEICIERVPEPVVE